MRLKFRRLGYVGVVGLAVVATAVVATPAHALAGIVVIEATSATNSTTAKSATATCPAGTVIYGGGGHLYNVPDSNQVRLSGLRPLVSLIGLTGFRASATEDDSGYNKAWSVTAYAICGPALAGWQVVWSISPTTSNPSNSATAHCPAGKKALSAGAEVSNGGSGVVLQLIVPDVSLDWAVAAAYEDETGYNGSWEVTAYAVCANPPDGLQRVTGTQDYEDVPVASAECPGGFELTGLGGYAVGGAPSFGQVYLASLYAVDSAPWEGVILGTEDSTGFGGDWSVVSYAICAY
jgi:hypothetical protein